MIYLNGFGARTLGGLALVYYLGAGFIGTFSTTSSTISAGTVMTTDGQTSIGTSCTFQRGSIFLFGFGYLFLLDLFFFTIAAYSKAYSVALSRTISTAFSASFFFLAWNDNLYISDKLRLAAPGRWYLEITLLFYNSTSRAVYSFILIEQLNFLPATDNSLYTTCLPFFMYLKAGGNLGFPKSLNTLQNGSVGQVVKKLGRVPNKQWMRAKSPT